MSSFQCWRASHTDITNGEDIQRALRNMIRENVCVEIDNHGASIAQRNDLCLSALYRNEGLEKQKYQD